MLDLTTVDMTPLEESKYEETRRECMRKLRITQLNPGSEKTYMKATLAINKEKKRVLNKVKGQRRTVVFIRGDRNRGAIAKTDPKDVARYRRTTNRDELNKLDSNAKKLAAKNKQ